MSSSLNGTFLTEIRIELLNFTKVCEIFFRTNPLSLFELFESEPVFLQLLLIKSKSPEVGVCLHTSFF